MKVFIAFIFLCFSGVSMAQHQDKVDFIHAGIQIVPNHATKEIRGTVTYTFKVLTAVDSIFFDARNMDFSRVTLNGKKVKHANDQKTVSIFKKFKAGKTYKVSLVYVTKPKQTVYFVGEGRTSQIWTQGQGKYTSHWLPSFDDMNEKVEFDLRVTTDASDKAIANGKLINKQAHGQETIDWSFDMQQPMSSYLLAFAIGDYGKKTATSHSGIPLEMYYAVGDSLKVEPTYRHTKRIFDFMEEEIGIGYPWQNYKQVPVKDFLYAGMENTTATIFADTYMIDSIGFVDRNYVNVNAHELAHQWFGDLVTEVSSNHHWLHEGFATYYAYLAEKEIFGNDHYYWKLYKTAMQLDELSRNGNGEALTNPRASSLTFYEKGAWALHMLKEEIGEEAFKKGVKEYLQKNSFKNVTIHDFLEDMALASGRDLSSFEEVWLNGTVFPLDKAKESLMAVNNSLNVFFELQWELTTSSENNETIIRKYWEKSNSVNLKEAIIFSYYKSLSPSFISEALLTDELKIRRAIAVQANKIPQELKAGFEALLTYESYVTVENILYKLWVHFPENRAEYLEKTKNLIGLPNKNVRLLWLTLSILTNDYRDNEKQDYYRELSGYTSPTYNFEIRQSAFQYLNDVFNFTDENLKHLLNACTHHSWQFRKFARNLMDKLLEDDEMRERFSALAPKLEGEEQRYINSKLNLE